MLLFFLAAFQSSLSISCCYHLCDNDDDDNDNDDNDDGDNDDADNDDDDNDDWQGRQRDGKEMLATMEERMAEVIIIIVNHYYQLILWLIQ